MNIAAEIGISIAKLDASLYVGTAAGLLDSQAVLPS
jgi:hypothetical protein